MTMAQSSSVWGAKRRFTVSDLLASEFGSVLSSFLALASRCIVRGLSSVLLFSYFSRNIFFCTRLCFHPLSNIPLKSVFPCSCEPSVLVLPSFPWLRYLPPRVRPPPSTSNYYLAPDLFLCAPTAALSICHPAPPSTRARSAYAWFLRSMR